MNTLEQIVATHPCPIIRGKIMENLTSTTLPKQISNKIIDIIDYFSWDKSNEGYDFWNGVFDGIYYNKESTYQTLKHLDNSYKPEPTTPTPKWLPIDRDNLPSGKVVAIDYPAFNDVYYGTLELIADNRIRLYIGGVSYMYRLTHYIPLSDLLNLPIAE